MRRFQVCTLGVVLIALQSGCATERRLPSGFSLERGYIELEVAQTLQPLPGAPGKGAAAASGTATGAAVGAASVGLMASWPCLFLGPFAGACFGALLPAAAATGAVVGGVAGGAYAAARSDSPEEATAKFQLFSEAMAGVPARERLSAYLRQYARASTGVELPMVEPGAPGASGRWGISVGNIDIELVQMKSGDPYPMTAYASLTIQEPGSATAILQKRYRSSSVERKTTSDWRSNEAAPARAALNHLIGSIAAQMIHDLSGRNPNFSDFTTPPYRVRAETGPLLKAHAATAVGVGSFTGPADFQGNCRALGPLAPPDGVSHSAYLGKAFAQELQSAGVHAATSPRVVLSGIVNRLEFSSMRSGTGGGFWHIDVTLNSSNGRSLRAGEYYEFDFHLSRFEEGIPLICRQTAEAYMPAVQNLIGTIVRSPDFHSLLQSGVRPL